MDKLTVKDEKISILIKELLLLEEMNNKQHMGNYFEDVLCENFLWEGLPFDKCEKGQVFSDVSIANTQFSVKLSNSKKWYTILSDNFRYFEAGKLIGMLISDNLTLSGINAIYKEFKDGKKDWNLVELKDNRPTNNNEVRKTIKQRNYNLIVANIPYINHSNNTINIDIRHSDTITGLVFFDKIFNDLKVTHPSDNPRGRLQLIFPEVKSYVFSFEIETHDIRSKKKGIVHTLNETQFKTEKELVGYLKEIN
jgi:hypothetical protein